jgi:hypothetical protein
MRDCYCCKRCLRTFGPDTFDDFEVMLLVHEAIFECASQKFNTFVNVTAGAHRVHTDTSSKSIYQQPLHILVEQGTERIVIDLMDSSSRPLATMVIDPQDIVNGHFWKPERKYSMKQKSKVIRNPRIKLTIEMQQSQDVEKGATTMLIGASSEVDNLVRLQLEKARNEGRLGNQVMSDLELLVEASSGPVEIFEGLGKTSNVYFGIYGPPHSKRWRFGIWSSKKEFTAKRPALQEVDIMKIQSVQADLTRHHVFVVNYFDASRMKQSFQFRRIDRARDVWVEVLHLLIEKVRESRMANKRMTHEMVTPSPSIKTVKDRMRAPTR